MAVTFDGPNKRIICTAGTTSITIKDVYSDWKEWVQLSDNSKYLEAFGVVGGDPTVGGKYLGTTYFLENDWKIRPQEASHTLTVDGNLYARDGTSPFVSTTGNYNVVINLTTSNIVDTIATGGTALTTEEHNQLMALPLSGSLSAEEHNQLMAVPTETLTTAEHDKLIALPSAADNTTAVLAAIIESGISLEGLLKLIVSVLMGKSSGGGTDTVKFRNMSDTKDRVVAVVDSNGNRTGVTLDAS